MTGLTVSIPSFPSMPSAADMAISRGGQTHTSAHRDGCMGGQTKTGGLKKKSRFVMMCYDGD